MPRVSAFFGIIVRMFYNDHSPPHFHAEYGEYEAVYEIETIEVLRGKLPVAPMRWSWNGPHFIVLSLEKTGTKRVRVYR